MITPAHTFHGLPGRVWTCDDVLLDCDPLLGAMVADEQTAEDWESDEADSMDVDEWISLTFRRWHRYQRDCQDMQRLLCWTLLLEHTYWS